MEITRQQSPKFLWSFGTISNFFDETWKKKMHYSFFFPLTLSKILWKFSLFQDLKWQGHANELWNVTLHWTWQTHKLKKIGKAHWHSGSSTWGRWHFWWKEQGQPSHCTSIPDFNLQRQHSSSFSWFFWEVGGSGGHFTVASETVWVKPNEEGGLTRSVGLGLHRSQEHSRVWIFDWERKKVGFLGFSLIFQPLTSPRETNNQINTHCDTVDLWKPVRLHYITWCICSDINISFGYTVRTHWISATTTTSTRNLIGCPSHSMSFFHKVSVRPKPFSKNSTGVSQQSLVRMLFPQVPGGARTAVRERRGRTAVVRERERNVPTRCKPNHVQVPLQSPAGDFKNLTGANLQLRVRIGLLPLRHLLLPPRLLFTSSCREGRW